MTTTLDTWVCKARTDCGERETLTTSEEAEHVRDLWGRCLSLDGTTSLQANDHLVDDRLGPMALSRSTGQQGCIPRSHQAFRTLSSHPFAFQPAEVDHIAISASKLPVTGFDTTSINISAISLLVPSWPCIHGDTRVSIRPGHERRPLSTDRCEDIINAEFLTG